VAQLVEFPLETGGTILVEISEGITGGPAMRGLHPGAPSGRIAEQAQRTFEDAISRVQPAAQSLIRRLRSIADVPDEVQVEFGLDLHAEAGAFIAAASTGANFKITLAWRQDGSSATSHD
jgi:hypothetical protein